MGYSAALSRDAVIAYLRETSSACRSELVRDEQPPELTANKFAPTRCPGIFYYTFGG